METITKKTFFIVSVDNYDETVGFDNVFDTIEECKSYVSEQTMSICNGALSFDKAIIRTYKVDLDEDVFTRFNDCDVTCIFDNMDIIEPFKTEIENIVVGY